MNKRSNGLFIGEVLKCIIKDKEKWKLQTNFFIIATLGLSKKQSWPDEDSDKKYFRTDADNRDCRELHQWQRNVGSESYQ
jgi:hypothetical protein